MTAPALGPNYPSGVPDRFYWIGTTFSDGSSYQVGFRDAALNSDCAGLEWFVAYFDAEVSTYTIFGGAPGLPTITYSPAVQVYRSGAWATQTGGRVHRGNSDSYWMPCPPYALQDLGTDSVRAIATPSGPCLADGAPLW